MRPFFSFRWILSHIFVVSMVVLMVNLGFWQLRRLDERKASNIEIGLAMTKAPVDLAGLLDAGEVPTDYTPASVSGVHDPTGEMLIANRTFESRAGSRLVTPLLLDDGRVIAIGGGRVADTKVRGLPELNRMDVTRFDEVTGLSFETTWVRLQTQDPPLGNLPVPVPMRVLDEGPHLSYAVQWFFFSTATVVVYYLILRAKKRELALET